MSLKSKNIIVYKEQKCSYCGRKCGYTPKDKVNTEDYFCNDCWQMEIET